MRTLFLKPMQIWLKTFIKIKKEDFNVFFFWSRWRDLNPRPYGPEPHALAELRYISTFASFKLMHGFV